MYAGTLMIIGGANGAIGSGLAGVAQTQGYPLYMVDKFDASPVVQGLLGDQASFHTLEVTDVKAVDQSIANAKARFGDVEQVIVVPAQGLGGADAELKKAGLFDLLYPTNVDGSQNLFDATRKHFATAKILCVGFSSIVDMYQIQMGQDEYRRSKTAMREMGKEITAEADPQVSSLTIAPGFVFSTMSKGITGMLLVSAAIQAAWYPEESSLLRQGLAEFLGVEESQLPAEPPELLQATLGDELYAPAADIIAKQLGPKAKKRLEIAGRGLMSRSIAARKLTDAAGDAIDRRIVEILLGIDMAIDPTTFGQIIMKGIQSGDYGRVFEIYSRSEPHDRGPIVEVFSGLPLDPPAERVEV